MAEPAPISYRAFLSYSHRDAAWGKWLHAALEGYRIDKDLVGRVTAAGAVPKTLRPIFRDREDFSAGRSLTEQTRAALDAAQFLVVICSPNAAQSQYVDDEIRRFEAIGRADRVIAVIVDGEPGDPARECFPRALRFKVGPDGEVAREEPLAADARPQGDGKEFAKLKVVAGLIGVGLDEIVRRADRARRRRLRNWVGALAALTLTFAGLAAWAELNRREAEAQRVLADQRREQAERNFTTAREVADSLVFNITQQLRDVPGVSPETVQRILARAGIAYQRLVQSSGDNPDVLRSQAAMYVEFGKTYAAQGNTNLQLGAARTALDIMKRLTAADPANMTWQLDLFVSHIKLGDASLALGHLDDALTSYRDGLALIERLANADPDDAKRQGHLAGAYADIGNVLVAQGNHAEALTSYRAGLAIRERLAAADPDNPDRLEELYVSYELIGDVLVKQGNLDDALPSLRSGLAAAERLAKAGPYNARRQKFIAIAQQTLGRVLVQRRDWPMALTSFRAGLAIEQRLATADPDNAGLQHDLAQAYLEVGKVLVAQGNRAEAVTSYRAGLAVAERVARLAPDNPERQFDVVVLLFQLLAGGDNAPQRLTDIVARMRQLKDRGRLSPERTKLLQFAEEELATVSAAASRPDAAIPSRPAGASRPR